MNVPSNAPPKQTLRPPHTPSREAYHPTVGRVLPLRERNDCLAKLVSTHGEVAFREAQDYKLRSRSLLRRSSAYISSPTSDEYYSRSARFEGQDVGIAERVPHIQEELDRLRAKMAGLARGISAIKEGLVHMSDFLELRSMVRRLEAEIAGFRQARLDTPPPTLSRGPAQGSRLSVSLYSGDRSPLHDFLKLFRT